MVLEESFFCWRILLMELSSRSNLYCSSGIHCQLKSFLEIIYSISKSFMLDNFLWLQFLLCCWRQSRSLPVILSESLATIKLQSISQSLLLDQSINIGFSIWLLLSRVYSILEPFFVSLLIKLDTFNFQPYYRCDSIFGVKRTCLESLA